MWITSISSILDYCELFEGKDCNLAEVGGCPLLVALLTIIIIIIALITIIIISDDSSGTRKNEKANLAEVGGGPLLVALIASRIAALSCAWFDLIRSPE